MDGVTSAVSHNENKLTALQTKTLACTNTQRVLEQTMSRQGQLLVACENAIRDVQCRLNNIARTTENNRFEAKMWISCTCVVFFPMLLFLYFKYNKVYGEVERVQAIVKKALKDLFMKPAASTWF